MYLYIEDLVFIVVRILDVVVWYLHTTVEVLAASGRHDHYSLEPSSSELLGDEHKSEKKLPDILTYWANNINTVDFVCYKTLPNLADERTRSWTSTTVMYIFRASANYKEHVPNQWPFWYNWPAEVSRHEHANNNKIIRCLVCPWTGVRL